MIIDTKNNFTIEFPIVQVAYSRFLNKIITFQSVIPAMIILLNYFFLFSNFVYYYYSISSNIESLNNISKKPVVFF